MAGLIERSRLLAKRAAKADIVKVFSLTSVSTLVKMCTGLISVKVVASIIGPAGVALVGQLNNFVTMALSLATGGINSGITKYVAEYREDESKVKQYLATAFKITVVCSLITGVLMLSACRLLSELILMTPDYWYVFAILGLTLILYGLNNLLISIVNGFKQFNRYVKINIANSIFGVIFTVVLVSVWGLSGALVSAVLFQSLMLFVSLLMVRDMKWMRKDYFTGMFRKAIASQYAKYAVMTFVASFTLPVVQILLRSYVISEISMTEAGWWEGMTRISNMYLMVVTSSFSVYYLPRLSELHDSAELRHEIFKCYKVIVPMLICGFTLVYLLRIFVIRLLFTSEFLPMSELFIWQLAGDFFKICSWLLAFLMVAKAMTRTFVATEIIFNLSYLALGYILVRTNGIVGLTQAYLINYIIYMLTMIWAFKRILFK